MILALPVLTIATTMELFLQQLVQLQQLTAPAKLSVPLLQPTSLMELPTYALKADNIATRPQPTICALTTRHAQPGN